MFKFQIITFKDHFHESEWLSPSTYKPKAMLLSYCGWLTKETDDLVVLSQGYINKEKSEDVEYDSHIHIMKTCIIKRKTIPNKVLA